MKLLNNSESLALASVCSLCCFLPGTTCAHVRPIGNLCILHFDCFCFRLLGTTSRAAFGLTQGCTTNLLGVLLLSSCANLWPPGCDLFISENSQMNNHRRVCRVTSRHAIVVSFLQKATHVSSAKRLFRESLQWWDFYSEIYGHTYTM